MGCQSFKTPAYKHRLTKRLCDPPAPINKECAVQCTLPINQQLG